MKALLICGSPHSEGCTYTALREIEKTLNKNGVDTEIFQIGTEAISGCRGCYACAKLSRCIIDDRVNELASRLDEFDAVVVGSPVYYAGANGTLVSFLDRLFYSAGGKMAGKVAAAVVSCRRGGASSAFEQINKYFEICNMITATSQYWNQVHGSNAEEVVRDEEGMQTMRTLGENIAYLLRLIECGKKNNIEPPVYEKKLRTNFIR